MSFRGSTRTLLRCLIERVMFDDLTRIMSARYSGVCKPFPDTQSAVYLHRYLRSNSVYSLPTYVDR